MSEKPFILCVDDEENILKSLKRVLNNDFKVLTASNANEGIKLFKNNTITTNGTLDLIEFPGCIYVVSVDGPPDINDAVRGKGSFDKVMKTISKVPENFKSTVMCQCVVTKANEDRLEELVEILRPTRAEGMTFSFYVPTRDDNSELTWKTLSRTPP